MYGTFSVLQGNTAGAGQHRLIRSAPLRPADVAVAQNDLPSIMRDRAWPCRAPCCAFEIRRDFPFTFGDRDDHRSDLLLMRILDHHPRQATAGPSRHCAPIRCEKRPRVSGDLAPAAHSRNLGGAPVI